MVTSFYLYYIYCFHLIIVVLYCTYSSMLLILIFEMYNGLSILLFFVYSTNQHNILYSVARNSGEWYMYLQLYYIL